MYKTAMAANRFYISNNNVNFIGSYWAYINA